MANENLKKFLDQQGVSTLWSKIAAKVAEEEAARAAAIKAEKERAEAAELALADKIGELPTDIADVVSYVNKKTEGIATDTALAELQGSVNTIGGDVATIKGDYLKSADKTELSNAIAAEAARADAAEKVNAAAIKAISDDYLKAADKTVLQGNIDAVAGKVTTLIGDDANKSVRSIAAEELAAKLVAEGAAESLDTLAEIAAWIQSHPEDASKMNEAIVALQKQLQGIDAGEGTVKAYVDGAIAALAIGDYAKAADLTAAIGRIAAIEADYLKAADKTELNNAIAAKADQTALEAVSAVANAAAVKTEVEAALALKATQADLEAEVSARQAAVKVNSDAIAGMKNGTTINTFAGVETALAGKQNTIAANTYDVYGAAADALTDANEYTDAGLATIKALTTAEIEAAIASASVTA